MSNKILDELVTKGVLERIAKNLKLHKVPTIEYEDTDSKRVMYACGKEWRDKPIFGYTEIVTRTTTDYVIRVNPRVLKETQKQYFMLCLNPKAMRDITLILLKHECRHLWQYQEQFMVGEKRNAFEFKFNEAHGDSDVERDANQYAIDTSKGNRLYLAKHAKILQEKKPFCFTASIEEIKACYNVIKAYNPVLALFLPKENA